MSIFDPWLPMYREGMVPERPWWRAAAQGSVRCDGRVAAPWAMTPHELRARTREEMLAEIDRIDAEHPLPVPPAMPGQVWAWSATEMAAVVGIREGRPIWGAGTPPKPVQESARRSAAERQEERRRQARMATRFDDVSYLSAASVEEEDYVWPPPGAVLVAGPSPWGRDMPWVPAGWRP